ncbi:MAG TPA: DUF308 domain-containing protein [Terriglobales bacterium]|nr:DUF308 domain-containing protein [Terriglobales bacterium]
MLRILIRHWWFLAVRAALALVLGLLAFPLRQVVTERHLGAIFLAGVQSLFGVFAMAAGVVTVAAALAAMPEEKWWVLLVDGAAGVLAGGFVLFRPDLPFVTLLRVIALWSVVLGLMECVTAVHVRRHLKDEWLLAASGVGTLLFAVVVLADLPRTDSELLVWLSWFAFFSATVMTLLALRMYRSRRHVHLEGSALKAP